MTPEREALIHKTWRRARPQWSVHGPVLRIPVRPRLSAKLPPADVPLDPIRLETLDYRLEEGHTDGRLWARIVCEGVVVAEGPR